jgi:phosphonate transport system substrate-binding protein
MNNRIFGGVFSHPDSFVETSMVKIWALAVLAAAGIAFLPPNAEAAAATAKAVATLRISAIPDEAPTELIRKFKPLARYLEKELGTRVKFIPLVNYAATVEALAAGKVDLVWYGGFTHVQARIRTKGKAVPLVMRRRDLKFRSKFITATGSGIKTLKDLKGKTFTFGSVSSTSGHLMPRFFLKLAGVVPERDFSKFSFSGSHDATAKWVEAGKVEAGAMNEAVWDKLVESGKLDPKKIRAFYTTPAYVDYNWTARTGLPRETLTRLAAAFLKLDSRNPVHKEILDLQRAEAYVLAFSADFKGIEAAARDAGLLKKIATH